MKALTMYLQARSILISCLASVNKTLADAKSTVEPFQNVFTEKLLVKAGLWLASFKYLFETFVFADWNFLGSLVVLIVADTITGIAKSLYQKGQLESRAMAKVFVKFIVYSAALILSHVLISYKVQGQTNSLFQWTDAFIYSMIVTRETVSIIENCMILLPSLFPPWFQERFSNYKKSGKISDLTGK